MTRSRGDKSLIGFIWRMVLNAIALLVVARLINGIDVAGFWPAFVAAVLLGVVNAIIRPIIIFLTLPLQVMTLGLITIVINGLLLWGVSSVVDGFYVRGLWPAMVGSLLLGIISTILTAVLA